jgi:hypothetical protein
MWIRRRFPPSRFFAIKQRMLNRGYDSRNVNAILLLYCPLHGNEYFLRARYL